LLLKWSKDDPDRECLRATRPIVGANVEACWARLWVQLFLEGHLAKLQVEVCASKPAVKPTNPIMCTPEQLTRAANRLRESSARGTAAHYWLHGQHVEWHGNQFSRVFGQNDISLALRQVLLLHPTVVYVVEYNPYRTVQTHYLLNRPTGTVLFRTTQLTGADWSKCQDDLVVFLQPRSQP
jgi:hypothetical protein